MSYKTLRRIVDTEQSQDELLEQIQALEARLAEANATCDEALAKAKYYQDLATYAHRYAQVICWERDAQSNARHAFRPDKDFLSEAMPQERGGDEDFLAHVHPDDRAKVVEAYAKSSPIDLEYRVGSRENGWVHVREQGETIAGVGNRPIRQAGVIQEISGLKQVEASLRRSEARFRDFAECASDWLWELDDQFRFTFDSGGEAESGLGEEDLCGRTRWEMPGVDANDPIWQAHRAVLEAHEPIEDFEFSYQGVDGVTRHARINGKPLFDEDGDFRGYRGTAQHITREVETLGALRKSQKLLETIFSNVPIGIAVKDREGRVLMVNQALSDLCGGKPEDMVGRHYWEFLDRDAARAVSLEEERILQTKEPIPLFEDRLVANGIERDLFVTKVPLLDEKDEVEHVVTIVLDITEQAQTQAALERSHEFLRTIIESAPIGISVKGRDGRYVYFNACLREMLELSAADPIGRTAQELFPGTYADQVKDLDRRVFESGEAPELQDFRVELADHDINVLMTKVPLFDHQGGAEYVISFAVDVTAQQETEALLRQSQKMEAVGQLTGGVAHDFNNLLAVILGNIELLGTRLADRPELERYIQKATGAVERGASLTQQLLAFSRKQDLQPRSVDVGKLVRGMTQMLGRTLGEPIEIETIGESDLWLCRVDPAQLENALLNLALNARDAMPEGGKLVIETANQCLPEGRAASGSEAIEPGDYVVVSVTDNGAGIAADVQDHIFEPFFTTKEPGRGTGLGLSMVYGFVKQSGGHVVAESEPGKGTTMRVYLPRIRQSGTERPSAPTTGIALAAQGETVLVVEDEPDVRDLVVTILTQLGYRVRAAQNGAEALACLEADGKVELLVSDVVLPGRMSGCQLAQEARRFVPGLRVLYMSGYTQDAIVQHGAPDESEALLQKPFRKEDIARAIRRILDRERAPAPATAT